MSTIARIVAALVACVVFDASYANTATALTMATAPDETSRAILAVPVVHFDDGAISKADVAGAISRNYPKIIEQNFARLNAADQTALVDKLSDVELHTLAQLYVNANSESRRTGALLMVFANRMDGTHLARIAKFFGYTPVYNAIVTVAPLKAQNFAQNASIVFSEPKGVPTTASVMASPFTADATVQLGRDVTPMQTSFKPVTSMTFQQLYTGFRTMEVGSMASSAAVYETLFFAGTRLAGTAGIGWTIGQGMTTVAQTLAPDWYYGPFTNTVGGGLNWFVDTATNIVNYSSQPSSTQLGQYQQAVAPVMSVPSIAQLTMEATGGDAGVTEPWAEVSSGGSGGCRHDCPPIRKN